MIYKRPYGEQGKILHVIAYKKISIKECRVKEVEIKSNELEKRLEEIAKMHSDMYSFGVQKHQWFGICMQFSKQDRI